jgi:ATP-binding cassette subfamily B protein AbcA/BmrA
MKDYFKAGIQSSWITNLSSPVYTIVGVLQLIMIVLVGRAFYQDGRITLANWIAYLTFAQQVANTLQSYAGYWATFKASQGATRRVTYIMEEREESLGTERSADDMGGAFAFHHVSFSYGDHKVLDDIDLELPEGKTTAFIGMSGGGKTTMLNLMERFYTPQEGAITVGGEDISSYNMKSYRENIAYITQESTMLSGTIKENILYGITREVSEEELRQACVAANAYQFIAEFPDGFETQVGEAGGKLSGGQKQRIAIARAMLKRPKFMFLDEATAALDAKAKQEVWFGLENLMGGKTTVMVAHDYQTASHADFVVVLDHGKIADKGTQEELYKRNQFFRDFVNGKEGSV